MIVDHRTNSVKIGKLNEFLKLYETEGLPLQLKYLGHCVGWYVSNDIGPLSQVVHLWAYKDIADRDARRAKMAADPAGASTLKRPARCSIPWRTRSFVRRRISSCRN